MAMLFAATAPERVGALILYATMARMSAAPDYEFAWPAQERRAVMDRVEAEWGSGTGMLGASPPTTSGDARTAEWFGRLQRLAMDPHYATKVTYVNGSVDVRGVLGAIQAPTLVLHRREDAGFDFRHSEYLAAHIPNARLVPLEGEDSLPVPGGRGGGPRRDRGVPDRRPRRARARPHPRHRPLHGHLPLHRARRRARRRPLAHPARAARPRRPGPDHPPPGPRDQVASGTAGWPPSTAPPAPSAPRAGSATTSAPSGWTSAPACTRASARSWATTSAASPSTSPRGSWAAPCAGEVRVSNTVKDLVVGSGLRFDDRGAHELRGVPGEWRLWAVAA